MWKKLNNWLWKVYHNRRKKSFKSYRLKENINRLKLIPLGALGSVFGANVLTINYERLVLNIGTEDAPTHSLIYLGGGDHKIAEADTFYSLNKLERYSGKRVVFHYFKDLTFEEAEEIKDRIYYLLSKKLIYDYKGYIGFVTRILPFLKKIKILQASDTTVFCSDGNVVIYHGDQENTDNEINHWALMRNISVLYEANANCPADIYGFMEQLHGMFPEKVGRIELMPE